MDVPERETVVDPDGRPVAVIEYIAVDVIRLGDGVGVARLGRSGRARNDGAGNDILLYGGGYNGDDRARSKRPVLGYGKTFRAGGYRCTSRATGLTYRRGAHGFFLSRETQRFF